MSKCESTSDTDREIEYQFYGLLSFDHPRRVVRNVHRRIASSTGQGRHCIASKRLTPSDPRILAGAASDDMGAAIHGRLRVVAVAGIEGRKNLVTVGIC